MRQLNPQRARSPASVRPRRRAESLLVVSGEGCLLDKADSLLERFHLPLFATHFGPFPPGRLVEEGWREAVSGKSRGRGRFRILAAVLARVAAGLGEGSRSRDIARLSKALNSWLASSGEHSTASLARLAVGGGELARRLHPVLGWSAALDAELLCLPPAPIRPGLGTLLARLPWTCEAVAVTSLPARFVQRCLAEAALPRAFARVWDDRGATRLSRIASHAGLERALCDEERGRALSIPSRRILVVGEAPADQGLARALGAAFYPLHPGDEEEGLGALAKRLDPWPADFPALAPRGALARFQRAFRA